MRLSQDEILKKIDTICKYKNYEFIGFYGGKWFGSKETKLILKCKKHDLTWDTTNHNNFTTKGKGCPICAKEKISLTKRNNIQYIIDNINQKCVEYNIEFIGFVNGKYEGNTTKLILKCLKHNIIWDTTCYSNFVNKKRHSGCLLCGKEFNKNQKINKNPIERILIRCVEDGYEFFGFNNPENKYINNHTKLILNHPKYGIWDSCTFNCFVNKKYNHINMVIGYKTDNEIKEWLTELNIEFITKDRKILKGWELDYYLPEHNLAIELNGEYWHSFNKKYKTFQKIKDIQLYTEKFIKNYPFLRSYFEYETDYCKIFANNKELFKTIICEKLNIKLIHINYLDWFNDKDNINNSLIEELFSI